MFMKRSAFVVGFVAFLMALTMVAPIEIGPAEIGPDLQAAVAATDTSSCDAKTGSDTQAELERLFCYIRLAKSDPTVCDRSPSPFVCFGSVAGELDDPNVIVQNLEGEERDIALSVLASDPESSADAASLIESNVIHDFAVIQLVARMFAATQMEGIVVAPPKDYCAKSLRGNYTRDEVDPDGIFGLLPEEEVSSNADICNGFVAAVRQLAYDDDACNAWLPTVLINHYNHPDGVQWNVDQCNKMADDIREKMEALGIELISKPEEEALADLAAELGAWVRSEAVINPGNHETHFVGGQGCERDSNPWWYWYCEPRYIGKTRTITPSATSIAIYDRHVDHGTEWHNMTFTASFTEPPAFLQEGDVVSLPATLSRSGSVTVVSGAGMYFEYWANGAVLEGPKAIGIDLVSGGGSITPSFTVPAPWEGGEIKITAGAWNCAPCHVEWVYRVPGMTDVELPPPTETEERQADSLMDEVDARSPSEINAVGKQAILDHVRGGVEVKRQGETEWQPGWEGMILQSGDLLRTGTEAGPSGDAARLIVSSQGAAAGDDVEVLNIPSDTEIGMTDLFTYPDPRDEQMGWLDQIRGSTPVDLIRGAIRSVTRGWRSDTSVRIKAGVTLMHVVGSDAIVSHDPDSGTVSAYVKDGRVDLTNVETGDSVTATAGQKATVDDGVVGASEPMASSEWEAMVYEQNLDLGGTYRGEPDLALFNPQRGKWFVRYQNGITDSFFYGTPGDTPLMGDWDCDGIDTVAMYRERNGFIYLRNTNDFGVGEDEFFYGIKGDIPIAGDWDGDGCDTFGIYRKGRVFLSNSLGTRPADVSFYFGIPGDVPFAGDFDGDGIDTVGLYRRTSGLVYFTDAIPAEGTVAPTNNQFFYGIPSDRIVTGDWDRDGDDTVGIYRGADQMFFISLENRLATADLTVGFGESGWLPASGEFGPGPASPGDSKNCGDFATQAEAQAWHDYYFPGYGDIAHLDSDGDGKACEG